MVQYQVTSKCHADMLEAYFLLHSSWLIGSWALAWALGFRHILVMGNWSFVAWKASQTVLVFNCNWLTKRWITCPEKILCKCSWNSFLTMSVNFCYISYSNSLSIEGIQCMILFIFTNLDHSLPLHVHQDSEQPLRCSQHFFFYNFGISFVICLVTGFYLHSLIISDIEHLSMCLLAICMSSLEKSVYSEPLPIFDSGFCCYCWHMSSLYILDINPLLDIRFVNIFFH